MMKTEKDRGLLTLAVTLAFGLALGAYIGTVGVEDVSLFDEAQAAGGKVTSPTADAPDR